MNFPAYKKVSVADLIPYARNARTHSEEQVAQIAASIREFGFLNPVIIDGDKGLIAGHGRVLAARKLGLESLPAIEAGHLSDAQRRAYILADNKLALNAGWNEDLLRVELGDLHAMDFDLGLTGFDGAELARFMYAGDIPPEDAPDESGGLSTGYEVVVECQGEGEQADVFDRLQAMGLKCRLSTL